MNEDKNIIVISVVILGIAGLMILNKRHSQGMAVSKTISYPLNNKMDSYVKKQDDAQTTVDEITNHLDSKNSVMKSKSDDLGWSNPLGTIVF